MNEHPYSDRLMHLPCALAATARFLKGTEKVQAMRHHASKLHVHAVGGARVAVGAGGWYLGDNLLARA